MYLDALSFLEDERDAWRPFEALADVPDSRLDVPVADAHGWSARDLIAHMVGWQELALGVAKDLAVGETSATIKQIDEQWAARGDAMNDDMIAAWRELPADEVRSRLRSVGGELRGYLTVVPETRWVKHPTHLKTFVEETLEHYDDHRADLEAILAAAGVVPPQ
ncbi:MAG TPA: maleylpyruvate isomerase N-terminal domain-containing protein [Candidatus Limnocylindrales bacterium]|nr:maleylpyruvate isomerase N-terminal domain-containing protein [Candidatus Limnocylindrales bacterium]